MQSNVEKNSNVQELRIDLAKITSKEVREIYLRHIIASIKEAKEESRKSGSKCQIELTVDLMSGETKMFERAKDCQGNRLFETGGTIRNTKLRIEQHKYISN